MFSVPKRTLKFISDLNYYKGGYPSETSPPRINALLERVGVAAQFFNEIDRLDELNNVLAAYGFELTMTNEHAAKVVGDDSRIDDDKKAMRAFEDLKMTAGDVSGSPKEVVEWFLERTFNLQHTICTMADTIKIDLFESAATKVPNLGKPGFITAVNTVANKRIKDRKNKDTERLIDKALEKSETMRADADLIEEAIIDAKKEKTPA